VDGGYLQDYTYTDMSGIAWVPPCNLCNQTVSCTRRQTYLYSVGTRPWKTPHHHKQEAILVCERIQQGELNLHTVNITCLLARSLTHSLTPLCRISW
jgi:uncharacterized Fe-S cluster protein YjdI